MSKREPPAGYMNTAGIAKVLNITTRRVQQLTKEGIITKEQTPAGGYYNLGVTLGMYLQNLREAITERETKTKQNEKIEGEQIEFSDKETVAEESPAEADEFFPGAKIDESCYQPLEDQNEIDNEQEENAEEAAE